MAGIHKFSGSFSHSGSTPAQFKSGIASDNIITGNFFGDGSSLNNLNFGISGSGPTVFALAKDETEAEDIRTRIEQLLRENDIACNSFTEELSYSEGAYIMT